MKFRHFVANADFGKLNVAVYGEDDSEIRVLKVHNSWNQKDYAATRISKKKYAEMREEWGAGLSSPDNDVVMTKRAIEWVNAQPKNHPNRKKRDVFSPEALKKLRAGAGWTQAECAAAIHSTRRTLQDWENGVSAMHPGLWDLLHIKAKGRI